ncbi:hypothetical protein NC652_011933 [Populus alba x Populus x berolinensis]|nr:hypothetical protein NC652_011933 [Populus alba x Populus x berolinensis]
MDCGSCLIKILPTILLISSLCLLCLGVCIQSCCSCASNRDNDDLKLIFPVSGEVSVELRYLFASK